MSVDKQKRGAQNRLGRGLDALFADAEARVLSSESPDKSAVDIEAARAATKDARQTAIAAAENNAATVTDSNVVSLANAAQSQSNLKKVAIGNLRPSQFQPRKFFDEKEIASLADSIKAHGILQPLLVRENKDTPGHYEIIGGERRWRAAQLAQLHDVPVIVQKIDDRAAAEVAIIENIQRTDLNPVEEARALERLVAEFGHSHEELGTMLGKSRSYIANMLRLLVLPESVIQMLEKGLLSAGHARTLINAPNPQQLALDILKHNLTVREAEHLATRNKHAHNKMMGIKPPKTTHTSAVRDTNTVALEKEMSDLLGFRVTIGDSDKWGHGAVNIGYKNLDQLDDILKLLTRAAQA